MSLPLIRNLLIATSLGLVCTLMPVPAAAEEVQLVVDEIEQSRATNEAKRQATIAANVNFTTEEMGKFWPAYWEYRSAVGEVEKQYIKLVAEYARTYQSMSDSEAKKLTETWLNQELERYNLKKTYVAKFQTALPAAKALRVMQIENKLDVMLAASIQKQIPLVTPKDQ